MVNDIIADSLTRIRNASMRRLDVAKLLYSKMVEAVMKVFQEKGYIERKKSLKDVLKYN